MSASPQVVSQKMTVRATGKSGNWFSGIANNQAIVAYLFILPSLIGFLAFFAIPTFRSVLISFTQWNLLTPAKYVGIQNYQTLFADQNFWQSLGATVLYVFGNIPLQTVLALFIAVMMDRLRHSALLRGIVILPWLMSNVVVALLWLWLFDPTLGIVNVIYQALGLSPQQYLGTPEQAIFAIAFINIWRYTGYNAILIFAGLKAIPETMYEAARIDGANDWTQFSRITLPLLRPVLGFILVTNVIGSFQIFDTIAITTKGGPAGATRVILYYIYDLVFDRGFQMGVATAASVVLFLILITITILQFRFLRANQSELADA
ncbi:MAG: carbohydrate ABC transporter permease [Aggregatilineales bacterium]